MNKKEFLEYIGGLLDETLSEELTMDTEFRYLDMWSSLTGLCFITDMKERYDKTIEVAEFKKAETLEDLYNLYLAK